MTAWNAPAPRQASPSQVTSGSAPVICELYSAVKASSGVHPARKKQAGREPCTAATTAAHSNSSVPSTSNGCTSTWPVCCNIATWLLSSSTTSDMPTASATTGMCNTGA